MIIQVWKKNKNAKMIEKKDNGSIGYDIFACEDVVFKPMEYKKVRTGLVIKCEKPYGIFIFPRSSLFEKKGLIMTNSVGIIDNNYCGPDDEILIPLLNITNQEVKIQSGEKIAQIVFLIYVDMPIEEIKNPPKDKSRGGFGSSNGYI